MVPPFTSDVQHAQQQQDKTLKKHASESPQKDQDDKLHHRSTRATLMAILP